MIVCGGRDDHLTLGGQALLMGLAALRGPVVVVHGDARGVDREAGAYAKWLGCEVDPRPADWRGRGSLAGPERNRAMLASGPVDVVMAVKANFDWSFARGGTEHMVAIAKAAGVPAYVLQRVGP